MQFRLEAAMDVPATDSTGEIALEGPGRTPPIAAPAGGLSGGTTTDSMQTRLLSAGLAALGLALFTAVQSAYGTTASGIMPGNETWSGNIAPMGLV